MTSGRYWHIQFIASGGFAEVYKAVDPQTWGVVAIKRLTDSSADNRRRFKRERDMLQIHLSNPFVVDILDSDLTAESPYLVLEYSELGSLQKYVAERRDWTRIARWLYDVAFGLAIIHERGDVIRDIKPANLLRFKREDGSELIKITDFGLGQRPDASSGPMTASPFGTQGYIDPMAQFTQNVTSASDIYSLGITMTELLTGNKNGRGLIPGPPPFRDLIASMTHWNPSLRPIARAIADTVAGILQESSPAVATSVGATGAFLFCLGAAALAVLGASANNWDRGAQRYRDSRGQFRSGRFF
jgi:eukaryotic-like serine/threonine-protein kinase